MGNSSSKSTGNIGETSNSMVDELDLLRGMQQQILLLQQQQQQQQPQMLLQPQQQQQMLLLQQPQPRSTAERQLRACLRLIAGSMNNLTENVQNLPLFAILVCTVQRGIANDGRFILFIEINGNNYYLWRGNNNPMGYKGQLSPRKGQDIKNAWQRTQESNLGK